MKVSYQQTLITQEFETIATLMSKVLGSDNSKNPGGKVPQTAEEAEAVFSRVFGIG